MVADSNVITNLGFMTLTKYLGSQPFLNLTVHEYLWGYNDPLVSMANKVIASKIPFSKFGILDRVSRSTSSTIFFFIFFFIIIY